MTPESIGSPWLLAAFTAVVVFLLALDLGVFHRHAHVVRPKEALVWSIIWIVLSLLFNAWVWHQFGRDKGVEFFTGYLLEKALSVDNIFVFIVIFSYFAVPKELEHRVLFWGILGALIMRALFIWMGSTLLQRFHWLEYVFGGFLILTAVKIIWAGNEQVHPDRNPVLRLFRRFVPTTAQYHGTHFWVREGGRRLATPLFLVLLVVESTDVIFAVDSIPAIFGVTKDPFIVYTSNICAILGLRALYFLFAGLLVKLRYLNVGLGLVLAFIGVKMCIAEWYKIPVEVSLGVVAGVIGLSALASVLVPAAPKPGDR